MVRAVALVEATGRALTVVAAPLVFVVAAAWVVPYLTPGAVGVAVVGTVLLLGLPYLVVVLWRDPRAAGMALLSGVFVTSVAVVGLRMAWVVVQGQGEVDLRARLVEAVPAWVVNWSLAAGVCAGVWVTIGQLGRAVFAPRRSPAAVAPRLMPGDLAGHGDREEFDDETGRPGLRRRARHEAAHVVVALCGGARTVHADVRSRPLPDGRTSGGQMNFDLEHLGQVEALWLEVQLCHAGNIVDHDAGHYDGGAVNDMHRALAAAAGILSAGIRPEGFDEDLTSDELMRAGRAAARRTLAEHAAALERITDRLATSRDGAGHEELEELLDAEPALVSSPAEAGR